MSDEEPTEPRRALYRDLRLPVDEAPTQADEGPADGPRSTRGLTALPAAPADRTSSSVPMSDAPAGSAAPSRDAKDAPRQLPGPAASPSGARPRGGRPSSPGQPSTSAPLSDPPPQGAPGGGRDALPRRAGAFRIALWGAPSSGKTLFLQMLPTAARQRSWVDMPLGSASVNFFDEAENAIINNEPLPSGTQVNTLIQLQLDRRPVAMHPEWLRPLLMRIPRVRRRIEARSILVQTVDRPGGDYADRLEEVVEELLRTDAIIFLYDPTRDMPGADPAERNSFEFFKKCLDTLRDRSPVVEANLPQSFAVCITKFDSLPVFDLARRGLWATQEDTPPFSPRVADDHASDFFDWLCSQDLHPSAPRLREEIIAKFPPERTRFFVTSASGFRLVDRRRAEVDLAYPENVEDRPGNGGGTKPTRLLASHPHPVNVMEPVLALYEMAREVGR